MGFLRSVVVFLMKDWVMGVVLTVLVLVGHVFSIAPFPAFERAAYDIFSSLKSARSSGEVVVVAYDEKTVKRLGPPPAEPSQVAMLVDAVSASGARAIALEFLYTSERSGAVVPPKEILRYASELETANNKAIREIGRTLKDITLGLGSEQNGDPLGEAVRVSGRVVLPVRPSAEWQEGERLPQVLARQALELPLRKVDMAEELRRLRNPFETFRSSILGTRGATVPYDGLSLSALALGHVARHPDPDGVLRKKPLLVDIAGKQIPAMALQAVRARVNDKLAGVEPLYPKDGTDGMAVGGLRVYTGPDYGMLLGRADGIEVHSFANVLAGETAAEMFLDKTVFVGYTTEDTTAFRMPWGEEFSPVVTEALAAENMLSGSYITRPGWAFTLEVAALLYFGIFIALVLSRVTWKVGFMIAGLSLLPWLGGTGLLFVGQGTWVMPAAPVALLVLGYGGVLARKVFMMSEAVRAEGVESLKMLGLTFQGQGMLDMAFEKFMRCPVEDKSVRELLYNLGLDFERKRMPAKAVSVYEHILKAGQFKDTANRAERLRQAEATTTFAVGAPARSGTVVIDTARELPTLGRYEVIRELGRGAMGTVYLGRDPKINRDVAIKTLSYEEVPAEELPSIKERFFKEAAAAGKLSHPNIMTIYDAGEDHDLAYMAMELLTGHDLSEHCRKENLLPPEEVMRIAADVARALDYAHKHGVVHRDIKPSNIMLLDDGTVKVTDFGVARVMDASQTSTGIVLGTPGYMSPEQVAGEKVTGQSDLFSLGSVVYELLTGEKAFQGESIAALMYNISRCSFIPLEESASGIKACAVEFVGKLLNKGLRRRYRSGEKAAEDAEACRKAIAEVNAR